MTAVALPNLTQPWLAKPRYLDFGVDSNPVLGGEQQRAARLGSRWAVEFSEMPSLDANCARALMAARFAARASGSPVSVSWPQPAFTTAIGAPAVDGAGQAGTTLNMKGLTAGVTLKGGLFFSVVVGTRNYLYVTTADAVANGAGKAAVAIAPMLRASPADGASLSFATPTVEGFIQGASEDWTLQMLLWVGLPAFTIQEAK